MKIISAALILSCGAFAMTPDELNALGIARRLNGNPSGARQAWLAALDQANGESPADYRIRGLALNNLGSLALTRERYEEAEKLLLQSRVAWEKADASDILESTASAVNLAAVYNASFRLKQAEILCKDVIAVRAARLGSDDASLAAPMAGLASLYREEGKWDLAEELSRRALHIREGAGVDPSQSLPILETLALTLADESKVAEAEAFAARAGALVAPGSTEFAESLNVRGWIAKKNFDYSGAEADYRKAAAIYERTSGSDSTRLAVIRNNLAEVLTAEGEFAEARTLLKSVLPVLQKNLGPSHPWVATALTNIAAICERTKDLDCAAEYFERAYEINRSVAGENSLRTANTLALLGRVASRRRKYATAESRLGEAVAIYRCYPLETTQLGITLGDLAAAYTGEHAFAKANAAYREAYSLLAAAWCPNDPRIEPVLSGYETILRQGGEFAEAERLEARVMTIRVHQALYPRATCIH